MKLVEIRIEGDPKAWSRVRVNMKTGAFYNDAKLKKWEKMVAFLMRQDANKRGAFGECADPVKVTMVAIYPRSKDMDKAGSSYPTHRTFCNAAIGDLDNCLKAINDALQKSRVVINDCQVAWAPGLTVYAAKGEGAGVCVRVEKLDPRAVPPELGFPVSGESVNADADEA